MVMVRRQETWSYAILSGDDRNDMRTHPCHWSRRGPLWHLLCKTAAVNGSSTRCGCIEVSTLSILWLNMVEQVITLSKWYWSILQCHVTLVSYRVINQLCRASRTDFRLNEKQKGEKGHTYVPLPEKYGYRQISFRTWRDIEFLPSPSNVIALAIRSIRISSPRQMIWNSIFRHSHWLWAV